MKTYRLIIIALTISLLHSPSFSQEQTTSDSNLTKDVVGTWQHIISTGPDGQDYTYNRQIQLFEDGTGICTKYVDGDSIVLPFFWDVVDGAIMLYVYDKRGKLINTDSQLIAAVDEMSMNLNDIFGSDDYGMVSIYRRKTSLVAQY